MMNYPPELPPELRGVRLANTYPGMEYSHGVPTVIPGAE
jgi:hypothetical protein